MHISQHVRSVHRRRINIEDKAKVIAATTAIAISPVFICLLWSEAGLGICSLIFCANHSFFAHLVKSDESVSFFYKEREER